MLYGDFFFFLFFLFSLWLLFFVYMQTPLQTPLPGTAHTPLPGMAQTPLPGTAQTPLTGSDGGSLYNMPTGGTPITPNEYGSTNENGGVSELKAGPGRPSPYMVSSSIHFCCWGALNSFVIFSLKNCF